MNIFDQYHACIGHLVRKPITYLPDLIKDDLIKVLSVLGPACLMLQL